jgi:hypothetical protein
MTTGYAADAAHAIRIDHKKSAKALLVGINRA